jgi:protein required for attachment to host cells
MRKTKTWVVVADGSRARLFINDGPGKGLRLLQNGNIASEHPPTREISTDRPGRTFDSTGGGRHAMEPPSDSHRHAKRAFAQDLAARLNQAQKQNAFDRIVLIAPPQALGDLRATLSPGVRDRVSGELNKDLTHLKDDELVEPVGAVLAV